MNKHSAQCTSKTCIFSEYLFTASDFANESKDKFFCTLASMTFRNTGNDFPISATCDNNLNIQVTKSELRPPKTDTGG